MGLCQGRTCGKLIDGMLSRQQDPAQLLPPTARPPVRAAKIKEYLEEDHHE